LITAHKYLHREEISDSRQLFNQPADDYVMKSKSQKPKTGKFRPEMEVFRKCGELTAETVYVKTP